jgi:hypothetical protein
MQFATEQERAEETRKRAEAERQQKAQLERERREQAEERLRLQREREVKREQKQRERLQREAATAKAEEKAREEEAQRVASAAVAAAAVAAAAVEEVAPAEGNASGGGLHDLVTPMGSEGGDAVEVSQSTGATTPNPLPLESGEEGANAMGGITFVSKTPRDVQRPTPVLGLAQVVDAAEEPPQHRRKKRQFQFLGDVFEAGKRQGAFVARDDQGDIKRTIASVYFRGGSPTVDLDLVEKDLSSAFAPPPPIVDAALVGAVADEGEKLSYRAANGLRLRPCFQPVLVHGVTPLAPYVVLW